MKQKLLFTMTICMVVMSGIFFSCSSDDNEVVAPQSTSVADSLIKSEHYQLIQNLQMLNNDLSASLSVTKGSRWKYFWRSFGDICLSDAKGFLQGALDGIEKGMESGGLAGAAAGALHTGTVTSVNASVKTAKGCLDGAVKAVIDSPYDSLFSSDQKTIERGYAYLNAHPDTVDKILNYEGADYISLELPEEYGDDAKYVASMHNAILYVLDHGISDEDFVPELSEEDERIFHSPEFIKWFDDTKKLYETEEWKEANMEMIECQIHKLFSDAVLEYVENIDDMMKVVNAYIKVIEADESLSANQKRIIYISLTVATYSFQHWDSVLDFNGMCGMAN